MIDSKAELTSMQLPFSHLIMFLLIGMKRLNETVSCLPVHRNSTYWASLSVAAANKLNGSCTNIKKKYQDILMLAILPEKAEGGGMQRSVHLHAETS